MPNITTSTWYWMSDSAPSCTIRVWRPVDDHREHRAVDDAVLHQHPFDRDPVRSSLTDVGCCDCVACPRRSRLSGGCAPRFRVAGPAMARRLTVASLLRLQQFPLHGAECGQFVIDPDIAGGSIGDQRRCPGPLHPGSGPGLAEPCRINTCRPSRPSSAPCPDARTRSSMEAKASRCRARSLSPARQCASRSVVGFGRGQGAGQVALEPSAAPVPYRPRSVARPQVLECDVASAQRQRRCGRRSGARRWRARRARCGRGLAAARRVAASVPGVASPASKCNVADDHVGPGPPGDPALGGEPLSVPVRPRTSGGRRSPSSAASMATRSSPSAAISCTPWWSNSCGGLNCDLVGFREGVGGRSVHRRIPGSARPAAGRPRCAAGGLRELGEALGQPTGRGRDPGPGRRHDRGQMRSRRRCQRRSRDRSAAARPRGGPPAISIIARLLAVLVLITTDACWIVEDPLVETLPPGRAGRDSGSSAACWKVISAVVFR